jgi:hypothetical protein
MTRAKLLLAAVCLVLGLATTARAQSCTGDGECDDGNFCNGMETCGVLLECEPGTPPEGQACDDGAFCTVGETCNGGACNGGAPRDCSAEDGQCTTGVCNEGSNACEPQPANQGDPCNDGLFCTVNDSCDDGACSGATRDCSAEDGQCTTGACNEGSNACEPQAANEGGPCNDTAFCTVGETCSGGVCGGGAPRDCSAQDGQCTTGVCNEGSNACEAQPANEGGTCDDGLFCTVGDVCDNGTCSGSTLRDCSSLDTTCTNGVCNEASDACQPQPVNNGGTCNDGQFCTVGDVCSNGTCAGPTPRDCSAFDGTCTSGVCNETTDACQAAPANEGGTCDDGQFCTVGDACDNGMCVGPTPRDCSAQTSACATGVCNEGANACQAQAANEGGGCPDDGILCTLVVCDTGACVHPFRTAGAGCDDGQFCTATDTCNGMGTCVGTGDPCAAGAECAATCNEAADSCFAPSTVPCADEGNVCTDDLCNGAGACGHPANTAPCDDGLFCNGADVCNAGACTHAGDPCAARAECANTCNETADDCITPANTPCKDDDLACTTDLCQAGVCAHAPVDSLCDQGECVLGVCAPGSSDADKRGCIATPVGEGEQCTDDGFACTDDTCSAGACLHVPIASRCVPPEDCTSAVCEPGQPEADAAGCIPGPVLGEGQECAEDGEPCTNDLCRTGTCAHDPVPDTVTCQPVTRAFRQALALEGLSRRLVTSVGEAFAPNTSGPAVVTQGSMVAHLTPVTVSLEQIGRLLSGKAPVPPGGRIRGVPKTLAQLRAEAAIAELRRKPAEVRAFLRLAGTAKRKRQVARDSARTLRAEGRLVLERMRKLAKELRRLRRVSQTFVP